MGFGVAVHAVGDHRAPDRVAVALDDGVGAAELVGFLGVEGGVDAAEDHVCARGARGPADLVAPQRVAGMDADADDVARLDRREVELLERLVGDQRVAEFLGRGSGDDEQPARSDDAHAEGDVARIDEMNLHDAALSS